MDRLSGDYNRGYTRGIMDVKEVFEYIQYDLKHHNKRLTLNLMKQLLECCLENRENLRESQRGFIRYNGKTDSFEFYEPYYD